MEAEADARPGAVCSSGKGELTRSRDLYGLALSVLPSALVFALAEPLLLRPEPPRAAICVLFPQQSPSWGLRRLEWRWRRGAPEMAGTRAGDVAEQVHGMRNSGTSTK
jgi:hypothetical protein